MPLFLALLHYPMTNRLNAIVTTSVTNFDIHDIARAARTYAIEKYFVVTPVPMQRDFTRRVIRHWIEEEGAEYNPTRGEALQIVEVAADLNQVADRIARNGKGDPFWIGTSARAGSFLIGVKDVRERLDRGQNVCLVFGTGHGIHHDLFQHMDAVLEPIWGPSDYNHLSVRSAVSIYLDRIFGRVSPGDRWKGE